VGDICTTIVAFCLFSYMLFYNLILLREAHVVAGVKVSQHQKGLYFTMHGLLLFFAVLEIILKNVYLSTWYTGITSLYYTFDCVVLVVCFNYSALKVIQFANENARVFKEVAGEKRAQTVNMSPLKKTMGFFTLCCVLVVAIFTTEIDSSLSNPESFPSLNFGGVSLSVLVAVMLMHAFGSVHACRPVPNPLHR
jgi:hypothetical protein